MSSPPVPRSSSTLLNLQALRGVACLMVVVFHLAGWEKEYGKSTAGVRETLWFGFAGVDLFFVLSGFIITHTNRKNIGRPTAAPGYLARRLWRIYPPFWVAMVVSGLAFTLGLGLPVLTSGWEQNWARWLLLLPGEPVNGYVAPAWTLTYEVLFYLVFTLLVVLPRRVGIVLMAAWGVLILGRLPEWGLEVNPYLAIPVSPFVLEFLAGCVVAALIGRGITRYGHTMFVVGVLYAVLGVAAVRVSGQWTAEEFMVYDPLRVAVFGPASALVVYGLAARELRGEYRAPSWLLPLGDASYSIYLTHCTVGILAVFYGCHMPHSKVWHVVWLMGTLFLCVAIGLVFHRVIERPLLRLIQTRKRPTSTPAA